MASDLSAEKSVHDPWCANCGTVNPGRTDDGYTFCCKTSMCFGRLADFTTWVIDDGDARLVIAACCMARVEHVYQLGLRFQAAFEL